jgi:uncharacterized membrane protein
MPFLSTFVLGFIAGLRTTLGPTFVSWAAWLGILNVEHTPFAFMGNRYTHIIFTALAVGEVIVDKLPSTPSRKAPGPFITRTLSGVFTGATVGAAFHSIPVFTFVGAIGSVAGTLGGAAGRAKLASLFHRDLPAAIVEDIVAIALGCLSVLGLR